MALVTDNWALFMVTSLFQKEKKKKKRFPLCGNRVFLEKAMSGGVKRKQQLHTRVLGIAFENMPHPEMRLCLCVPWS